MNIEHITIRCDDNAEAVVFSKCSYEYGNKSYEITVEDSYIGVRYQGLLGRFRRAWAAFIARPVVYSGIYCEDKDRVRNFLTDCLALVDE